MSIDNDIERDIERDIVAYLGAHFGLEPEEITDDAGLEDLGVDSLGVAAIAVMVETGYGVSLDDERMAGVRTVADLKELIALKCILVPAIAGSPVDHSMIGARSA